MKNEQLLSVGRVLFRKGFSFCMYRFPNEQNLNLAVQADILPHQPMTGFTIAPFVTSSVAPQVHLYKIDNWADDWRNHIHGLPDRATEWASLPPENGKEQYLERLSYLLKDMRAGVLDKAILSRVILAQKGHDFDPFRLFTRLCEDYPDTFGSIFYKPGEGIWIGATPEILLIKDGEKYRTMALAGTQPRKNGDYQWRQKELEEHEMVGRHIEQVFENRSYECLEKKGPFTIEAARVAHLRTDYVFARNDSENISAIVADLHPTPAIGGLPVDIGVECILKYEGYDRKYYCGYIGETNGIDSARLFINLRCLQVGKTQLAVFAGGGITASSNEEEEWNETVQKSLTMLEKI